MANLTLFEKLDNIESRYEELTQQLSSPEVHNDSARFQKFRKVFKAQSSCWLKPTTPK
jgi:protein subunit release factor A